MNIQPEKQKLILTLIFQLQAPVMMAPRGQAFPAIPGLAWDFAPNMLTLLTWKQTAKRPVDYAQVGQI